MRCRIVGFASAKNCASAKQFCQNMSLNLRRRLWGLPPKFWGPLCSGARTWPPVSVLALKRRTPPDVLGPERAPRDRVWLCHPCAALGRRLLLFFPMKLICIFGLAFTHALLNVIHRNTQPNIAMRKSIFAFLIMSLIAGSASLTAQSYAFGFKGGVGGGMQLFKNFSNRSVLLTYHGSTFIETADEENEFSLFAQLGYHQRGSQRVFGQGFTIGRAVSQRDVFNNASLVLGARQKFPFGNEYSRFYYGIGMRGEYTISQDSDNLSREAQGVAVRRWLWGVTFQTGLEWAFSEHVAGILELSIHPDLSRQMFIPQQRLQPIPGSGSTQTRTVNAQSPTNVTVELSIGLRFLHKVEYID